MVTEYICRYANAMDIIQFCALIGISIGVGFMAYGMKAVKKGANKFGIKTPVITIIVFILTLIVSFFDAFICSGILQNLFK